MAVGRNILLFHAGALGDFIVTWPLALTLARLYPQSRVFYVTQAGKGALAEKVLRVESLDVEAGWHHLFSETPALPELSAKRLAGAHTVVSFVAGNADRWVRNVRAMCPSADVLTLTSEPPDDYGGHVSEFILGQLPAGSAAHTAAPQILRSIATRGVAPVAPPPAGPVVIHPGAGAPRKCWPADRVVGLIERLRADGVPVRVLLGEVERETWPTGQLDRIAATAADVASPASLIELLGHVRDARCFVGNDSGPGHLAGILGGPTVSIFGPADPARWRPLGPQVEIVTGPSLDAVPVDEVYEKVTRAIAV